MVEIKEKGTVICPSCGTVNPVGRKFCMKCGSSLTVRNTSENKNDKQTTAVTTADEVESSLTDWKINILENYYNSELKKLTEYDSYEITGAKEPHIYDLTGNGDVMLLCKLIVPIGGLDGSVTIGAQSMTAEMLQLKRSLITSVAEWFMRNMLLLKTPSIINCITNILFTVCPGITKQPTQLWIKQGSILRFRIRNLHTAIPNICLLR